MTEHKLSEKEIKPFPFYGYAPGNYMNTCACCKKEMYRVDKLCFVCLECAIKANYAALTRERERVKEVESGIEILKELCQLKHYKDNVGKDAFYEKTQPELWAKANEFLNNYKNNK